MRLEAWHVLGIGGGDVRLTLEGAYAGEVCQVAMSLEQAYRLAADLLVAGQAPVIDWIRARLEKEGRPV